MNKKYISVHSLNQYIKSKFIQDIQLQNIYIKGEVSNYRPHPSGHLYFTLKDDSSRISAVMFASLAKNMSFQLENGMQILVNAKVAVYEATGQYQLYIQSIEQDGIGNLYLQYEMLKKKLENEGLFSLEHKKKIPYIPHRIAVLSAKQGAAVWDVVKTIQLRAPFAKTVVFPIPVQGNNAYLHIIDTLKNVDKIGFDVIILARGGGSIEDLMNFNNESLARTIYELKTPIITGIGHETDFTICDFVSDLRAVTPTGAAMSATPDYREMKNHVNHLSNSLITIINNRIEFEQNKIKRLSHSYFFINPEQLYLNELLKVSQLEDNLINKINIFINKHLNQQSILCQRLYQSENRLLSNLQYNLDININKLDMLSPLKILSRGYNIIYKDNVMIKKKNDLKENDNIIIKMHDGEIEAKVKQVI